MTKRKFYLRKIKGRKEKVKCKMPKQNSREGKMKGMHKKVLETYYIRHSGFTDHGPFEKFWNDIKDDWCEGDYLVLHSEGTDFTARFWEYADIVLDDKFLDEELVVVKEK